MYGLYGWQDGGLIGQWSGREVVLLDHNLGSIHVYLVGRVVLLDHNLGSIHDGGGGGGELFEWVY